MKNPTIHTALSPAQCRERLTAAIDNSYFGSGRLMGSVDDAGFRLQIRLSYQNSFQTMLWGKFVPDAHGTTVEMRAGMHPFVIGFMCLWMTGATLGSISSGVAAIGTIFTKGITTALPAIGFSIGFPLFGIALVTFGRWLAREEEVELADLVCQKLKAS